MLKKIKKWVFFLVYFFIAKHFPVSNYPLGKVGRYIRGLCCKNLFNTYGKGVNIESGADFGMGDLISIGDNSGIGVDAWIRAELEIGDNVMMAPQVIIYGRDHEFSDTELPMNKQGMSDYYKVVIADDVWIGARSTILKGVTIGKGAVIAACSVVTKDVEPGVIVAGNPAKPVRSRS